MASSGYCDCYIQIENFSTTTGESNSYIEFTLASAPQRDIDYKGLIDKSAIIPFNDSGYATIELKQGINVTVYVNLIGLETTFTVPAQDSFNIASLIKMPAVVSGVILTNMQRFLHPEYVGAILYADGSNNNGQFRSSFEIENNKLYNFYEWTSNGIDQHGEIIVSTDVPKDLFKWSNIAIEINYKTGILNTDKLSVSIYKQSDNSLILQRLNLSTDNGWGTLQILKDDLSLLNAGDLIFIKLNCIASNLGNNFVRISTIKMFYQR